MSVASAANGKQLVSANTTEAPQRQELLQRVLLFTLVFSAACLMFFAELGKYPLFNPDEALYAEPAREALETGEYITSLLNYVARYTKPPLVIWAQAACMHVFGWNEFAARFVGAACGALMVACTYLVVEKYVSRRSALLAAMALSTAPLFIATARLSITDMPLTLFVAGAIFSFFRGDCDRWTLQCSAPTTGKTKSSSWVWVGYVLTGLAVMTKGPVGLVLPVAVLGIYHLIRGDVREAWAYYKPLWGLALVALIAVPWFAVEIYITKGAYYREFLVRENFQRFTGVVDHKFPWWYHFAAIAGGFLPWTIFLPQSLVDAVKSLKTSRKRDDTVWSLTLLCVVTTVVIVGFFSASVSKLLPYTVPAFPAMAVLLGIYLDKQISAKNSRAVVIPLVVLTAALGLGLAIVPVAVNRLREAPLELVSIIYSALLVLLVVSLSASVSAFRRRIAAAVTFFGLAFYFCLLGFGGRALDVLSKDWEVPLTHFSHYASLTKLPVFVFHMRKPSVPFYLHRPVRLPHDEAELIRGLEETREGAYIFAKAGDAPFLQSLPNCRIVAREGRFILVSQAAQR